MHCMPEKYDQKMYFVDKTKKMDGIEGAMD